MIERDETARSLNTWRLMSKTITNAPILRNNHKLRSIVVNKGQIQGKYGIFEKLFEI